MRALRALAIAAALLCVWACSFRPRVHQISAGGARVVFPVGKRVLSGELIAVQEGYVFLILEARAGEPRELVRVARQDVGHVRKFETTAGRLSGRKNAAFWERFRLASRHPQGLDSLLQEQLLLSLGQQSVAEVRP